MDFFGPAAKPDIEQIGRVKQLVRQHWSTSEESVVMVTELRCTELGCPPIETVIALMEGPASRRQAKVHQPVAAITESDIVGLKWAP